MLLKYIKITIYLLLLIIPSSVFAERSNGQWLYGMRVSSEQDKSRLVFDFKDAGSIKYHAFALDEPDRVVIDLPATHLAANLENAGLLNTVVKDIRCGFSGNHDLRLVLDLKVPVSFRCLTLNGTHGTKEKRLVLDLLRKNPDKSPSKNELQNNLPPVIGPVSASGTALKITLKKNSAVSSTPAKAEPKSQTGQKSQHNSLTPKAIPRSYGKLRDITIVIDPGHGGEDSGAVGIDGIKEKNIVLSIAKYLQHYLNNESGFRALLTRNGDYFISLRDRLNIAHFDHADLFIAIHADACDKTDRRGASVYALSQRGATSELARWLAEKENASELGHVIADKNLLLKSVLIDLAQTLTINNSLLMGNIMLQELSDITGLHINHVEQAAFVVLKSPDIPSLLVETGFISNPREENRLNNSDYQRKIAYALAQGIKEYYVQHPTPGTYFGAKRR